MENLKQKRVNFETDFQGVYNCHHPFVVKNVKKENTIYGQSC